MRLLALFVTFSFLFATTGEAKTHKASGSASKHSKTSKSKKQKATTKHAARAVSLPARQIAPSQERYMEIQQALAERGYYEGPVTGVWDANCVDALKKFQADQALKPDGRLGALSLIGLGLGPQRRPLAEFTAKPELLEAEEVNP